MVAKASVARRFLGFNEVPLPDLSVIWSSIRPVPEASRN
jgi:hypothetical protein